MRLSPCAPPLTFCLLLCIALTGQACKSGPKTIKAPREGEAGMVQQVEGVVRATRAGAKPRDLKKDHIIYVDDTVHTTANSSVAILLTHNGAVHNIGADVEVTVKGSLAWNATVKVASAFDSKDKQEGPGAAGAHSKGAAGETNPILEEEETTPEPDTTPSPPIPPADPLKRPPGDTNADSIAPSIGKWPSTPKGKTQDKRVEGEGTAPAVTASGDGIGGKTKDETPGFGIDGRALREQHIVLKLARSCREVRGVSGSFELMVQFVDSKIVRLGSQGPPALRETLKCLEEKIRKLDNAPIEATWIFSFKL